MKKFIKWHKLIIGRAQVTLKIDNYGTLWLSWIKGLAMGIILMMLLSGCYVYSGTYSQTPTTTHSCELMDRGQSCLSDHSCCKDDSDDITYWRTNYASTVGLYYYNDIPYWGYYSGHYYYYGYRHMYPWWYYYNSTPPYYYGATTHVHCHIGNSGYVYRPRGNWRHNNKINLTYHHDKVHNTGTKVKNNSNRPVKWRNTKVKTIRNNKTKVKTNTIYTRPNVNIKSNNNKTNIKNNTNKSNIRTNSRSNIKINNNKSNNRTNNRSTKSNKRNPR